MLVFAFESGIQSLLQLYNMYVIQNLGIGSNTHVLLGDCEGSLQCVKAY